MPLLPDTEDENDRTSRSSSSTFTSAAQAAKLKRILSEKTRTITKGKSKENKGRIAKVRQ